MPNDETKQRSITSLVEGEKCLDQDMQRSEMVVAGIDACLPHAAEADRRIAELEREKAELVQGKTRLIHIALSLPAELRKWWSFDGNQQHTHSWHSREDFIEEYTNLMSGCCSLLDIDTEQHPTPAPPGPHELLVTAVINYAACPELEGDPEAEQSILHAGNDDMDETTDTDQLYSTEAAAREAAAGGE